LSDRCATPIEGIKLLDYWLGELSVEQEEQIEEHLFACDVCHRASTDTSALVARLAQLVPPVLTSLGLERLSRRGIQIESASVAAGADVTVDYPGPGALRIHRLRAELDGVERLDLQLYALDGTPLGGGESVPFDAPAGEVLLACQAHYHDTFPDQFLVKLIDVQGETRHLVAEYTLRHRL
jgi:hypothetical protein